MFLRNLDLNTFTHSLDSGCVAAGCASAWVIAFLGDENLRNFDALDTHIKSSSALQIPLRDQRNPLGGSV